ncbi:hypothetical protein DFH27DRAFT_652797 [Peziza echinospora]|nr:hypothetical protein DFH27DRAFT_652797 [Peziza echinospora]
MDLDAPEQQDASILPEITADKEAQAPPSAESALSKIQEINDSYVFNFRAMADQLPRRVREYEAEAKGRRNRPIEPDALDPDFIRTPRIVTTSLQQMMEIETMDRYAIIEISMEREFKKAISGCECGECRECQKWLNPIPPTLENEVKELTAKKRAAKKQTVKLLENIESISQKVASRAEAASQQIQELSKINNELRGLSAAISMEEERIGGDFDDTLPLSETRDLIQVERLNLAKLEAEIVDQGLRVTPRKEKIITQMNREIETLEWHKMQAVEAAEYEKDQRRKEREMQRGDREYAARWYRASLKALEVLLVD